MTDAPEGPAEGEPERGSRRSPRVGDGGSPVGSTLSIVLAVIAVIAGFFILRAITDDDGDSGSIADTSSTVPDDSLGSVVTTIGGGPTTPTGPTTPAPSLTGATVSVANASGVSGSAASMTQALAAAGYTMGEAGNNSGGADLTTSVVYYAPGDVAAQGVALSVAQALGGVTTEAMPNPPPIDKGLGTSTVLVMVGTDTAGKSLAELAAATTPTTGAGGVAPPAAVGVTTTTTDEG
jgi:hypothetical protein